MVQFWYNGGKAPDEGVTTKRAEVTLGQSRDRYLDTHDLRLLGNTIEMRAQRRSGKAPCREVCWPSAARRNSPIHRSLCRCDCTPPTASGFLL